MSGYEAKFVHPLLKRHECPICLFAMRNPVQAECGHLFCKGCLDTVLKRRRPICPLDKEEISQDGIFPDNACRREIDVYCNFMTSGCTWIGPLKELEIHIESCEYREVQCTQCGQYVQVLELTRHKETVCPMRPELCPHCGKEVPSQQMQPHVDKICLEVLHSCPNGCDSPKMKLPELERHLAIKGGQCSQSEVDCPFQPYGCSFVSIRKNIPTHLEQYSVFHCQIQAECFAELKQQAEKNTAATQHLLERVGSLETRLNAVERLQDTLEQLDDQRERHSDGHHYESIKASYHEDSWKPIAFETRPIAASTFDGIEANYVVNTSIQNTTGNTSGALVPSQLPIPKEISRNDLPSPPNESKTVLDGQCYMMSAATPAEISISQNSANSAETDEEKSAKDGDNAEL